MGVEDFKGVLTAVFFNFEGATLTPGSAILSVGSTVLNDEAPTNGVVGGEWSYLSNISSQAPLGANSGISSAGLGIFGGPNFPGVDLDNATGGGALDGAGYGLVSAGGIASTANDPNKNAPLIKNSVTFTLFDTLSTDFSLY